MNVELIANTPNPEEVIEQCGRTCYKSPEKDAETRAKFITGIIRAGHTSVIEHATATFRITGVSRSLTHQLVRHRLFSFSQQSQRYVKETEPNYITPISIQEVLAEGSDKKLDPITLAAHKIYDDCMQNCWRTYQALIELGIKKEDARFVLPNAACTEICVSGNFREWYNFLSLRLDVHAQWEIRQLAWMILDKLMAIAPNVFIELKNKFMSEVNDNALIKRTAELVNDTSRKVYTEKELDSISKNIKDNTLHDIKEVMLPKEATALGYTSDPYTPIAEFNRVLKSALEKKP